MSKLDEFKEKDTLELDSEEKARRGSRGSILSGKANIDQEPSPPTIPTHHLAKLSLSTCLDYVNFVYNKNFLIGLRR